RSPDGRRYWPWHARAPLPIVPAQAHWPRSSRSLDRAAAVLEPTKPWRGPAPCYRERIAARQGSGAAAPDRTHSTVSPAATNCLPMADDRPDSPPPPLPVRPPAAAERREVRPTEPVFQVIVAHSERRALQL